MRTKFTAILLATTAAAGLAGGVLAQTTLAQTTLAQTTLAQTTLAQTAAPAAPAAAQAQPAFDLSQLPATHGTVRFFTLTPRGDVDGFVLADGTEVHLPPHLSAQLEAAVKVGDAVTVRGLRAAAVPMVAAMSVTGDANGQTVVDNGPDGRRPGPGPGRGPGAPPARAAVGDPASLGEVSGKVLIALHGPRGELNGAMLEDGTALRLPPPEAARLSAMLQPGGMVVAQGRAVTNAFGRVVEVRGIGATRDTLQQVQAPPPHGPRADRRGPDAAPGPSL